MLSLRTLFAAIADPAAIEFGPPSAQPGELRRLRQRDERAWQDLFEREWTDIYRYAHARTASTADAEDLTARVFEEAWKHIDSVEDRGLPARAWLFGIARHVVASHRRKLLRRPPIVALEAFDGVDGGTADGTATLDLARALQGLKPAFAEVVTLRFLHGLSLQETALALQTTVDAVKSRQARALDELRKTLLG
jgi:RNA polymerase sigma-70 factor (ECF subfamily)